MISSLGWVEVMRATFAPRALFPLARATFFIY